MAGIMFEKDETAISCAIFNNDVKALKEALESGVDQHYKDRKGNTYLHYISTLYRPSMIHVVIGTGIDLNAQNRHGNTALHVTALQNECCHVGDLMAAGINPTLRNNNGKTAAEIPTQNLFWKTIYDKYQPGIFEAVTAHDVDRVLHLLHCWSWVNSTRNGLTLRHFAASLKYHDLVYYIDLNSHTLGAIHAVLEGDEEKAKACMSSSKCDVNYVNYAMDSKHILQDALRQNNYRLVNLICSSQVDVNLRVRIKSYLKAPLFFAALDPKLSEKIMWRVLRSGADFSLRDERGRNAAIYALDKWHGIISLEVISFMFKNGLDISHRDETGVTLRDVARFARRKDILALIDKAYVKILRTSNIPEMERLCGRGYDGMIINFNYRDTFIYANGNKTDEVLDFTQWIPKFCAQVRKLYHCIRHKSLEEVIQVFSECQRPEFLLNAVDKGGRAAIHRSVLCWRSDVLKELIRRKCDVNLQDNTGRTAYHYACALEEEDERSELRSILIGAGIDQTIKDFRGHEANSTIGDVKAHLWLAKERKMAYGMVKQLTCVDKYEELCHMMKYKKKNLKHFNAALRAFKYPVPKFEEILHPLMPDYQDLLFIAMETGKEDIAVCLVKLGANWRRVEKTSMNVSLEPRQSGTSFASVLSKAKELGMETLVDVIERQKIHEKKVALEKEDTEERIQEQNKRNKISKIRKFKTGAHIHERKSSEVDGDDDDNDDVLFEEELVSDDSDVSDDEIDEKNDSSPGPKTDPRLDDDVLESIDSNSDASFYSDDFDM